LSVFSVNIDINVDKKQSIVGSKKDKKLVDIKIQSTFFGAVVSFKKRFVLFDFDSKLSLSKFNRIFPTFVRSNKQK
jgi:hypothetical protein